MYKPSIISFGEILWDLLPTGKIAGGAPMNVAFHASRFGLAARMISKTGNDELGRELKSFLEQKGVDTDLIQIDNTFPTGMVNVTLDPAGTPSYEIVGPVAWDFIQTDEQTKEFVKNADALVFGSLACRTERNKQTLLEYLDVAALRVFDVNFRQPFVSKSLVDELLPKADIVKMNDEELAVLTGWYNVGGDETTQLEFIKSKFDVELIIVTKGKDGAICIDETGIYTQPGFAVTVQDTVGSGDAFLAGFLSRFLKGGATVECLLYAAAAGALVATKAGGTPHIEDYEVENFITARSSQNHSASKGQKV